MPLPINQRQRTSDLVFSDTYIIHVKQQGISSIVWSVFSTDCIENTQRILALNNTSIPKFNFCSKRNQLTFVTKAAFHIEKWISNGTHGCLLRLYHATYELKHFKVCAEFFFFWDAHVEGPVFSPWWLLIIITTTSLFLFFCRCNHVLKNNRKTSFFTQILSCQVTFLFNTILKSIVFSLFPLIAL